MKNLFNLLMMKTIVRAFTFCYSNARSRTREEMVVEEQRVEVKEERRNILSSYDIIPKVK